MTITSTTSVGKTYVLLREAGKLMRGPQGDDLPSGSRMMIAALQLRSFTLVRDFTNIAEFPRPVTVAECLERAASQTSEWDLNQMPTEAADFIVDLAEVRDAVVEGIRP